MLSYDTLIIYHYICIYTYLVMLIILKITSNTEAVFGFSYMILVRMKNEICMFLFNEQYKNTLVMIC